MKEKFIMTFSSVLAVLLINSNMSEKCSGAGIVSENADVIKSAILMTDDYAEDISRCDTNGDNLINIFDLCREKNSILYEKEKPRKPIVLSLAAPEADIVSKTVYVPVAVRNTDFDISSVQLKLNYDKAVFRLKNVIRGSFDGQFSFSDWHGTVQAGFGQGICQEENGILFIAEFEISSNISSGTYRFAMSEIQAAHTENNVQKPLLKEELNSETTESYVYIENTPVTEPVTTVSEPPVQTTVTTTVPETEPVTLPQTTPPVTTSVPVTTTTRTPYNISAEGRWFYEKINSVRAEKGLGSLILSDRVAEVCDQRARLLEQDYSYELPGGKKGVELFYQYDLFPVSILQFINNSGSIESAYSAFVSGSGAEVFNTRYNSCGLGHYQNGGRHYWYFVLTRIAKEDL